MFYLCITSFLSLCSWTVRDEGETILWHAVYSRVGEEVAEKDSVSDKIASCINLTFLHSIQGPNTINSSDNSLIEYSLFCGFCFWRQNNLSRQYSPRTPGKKTTAVISFSSTSIKGGDRLAWEKWHLAMPEKDTTSVLASSVEYKPWVTAVVQKKLWKHVVLSLSQRECWEPQPRRREHPLLHLLLLGLPSSTWEGACVSSDYLLTSNYLWAHQLCPWDIAQASLIVERGLKIIRRP